MTNKNFPLVTIAEDEEKGKAHSIATQAEQGTPPSQTWGRDFAQ